MRVEMKVQLSGSVDGKEYPARGAVLDTTDSHGAELCAAGLAVPVVSEPAVERAVAPEVEKRTTRKRTAK
jgi:hypothetical protein